jgi:carbon-monoxide dehydrogenase large subunit
MRIKMINRDTRIASGKSRFIDDIDYPDMAHMVFVGSPYAHARILGYDVTKALGIPGVLTVITGQELADLTNPIPLVSVITIPGCSCRVAEVYALAVGKVRWYGEPVVAVIAEDEYTAVMAADLVEVEYEPLPVVNDTKEAMKKDAPLLYDDWEDNKQVHLQFNFGDVESCFNDADRVLHFSFKEGRASAFPPTV